MKPAWIKLSVPVAALLVGVSFFAIRLAASPAFSYQFTPSPSYLQTDSKAALHTYGYSGPPYPAMVAWLDPHGASVSYCNTGDCGASYDQLVADNGILVWRDFYFYIDGQQRLSGVYTAVAYSYQSPGIYTEMFRANFDVSGVPQPTPPPSSTPLGALDAGFGTGGVVDTNFSYSSSGRSLALQADGKVLLAGEHDLARYNPDGSPDPSFGSGGVVDTSAIDGGKVALQADEKIIVAGSIYSATLGQRVLALMRLNPGGSLDTGFGHGGLATTAWGNNLSASASTIALQGDGKIILAGRSSDSALDNDSILARYNPDGSLDTGFGSGGKVTSNFGTSSEGFYSIAVQPDGKIVAGGAANNLGNVDFVLARYTSNGSPDTGFGDGGKVIESFGGDDEGNSVAIQPDGKIIIAGDTWHAGGYVDLALARYNPDGSLDAGFGSGGKVTADFTRADAGKAVALQADGKILVAGNFYNGTDDDLALVRFTSDGRLDTASGTSGKLTSDFGGNDRGFALAVQPDGKVLVAGENGVYDAILARYVLQTSAPGIPLLLSPDNGASSASQTVPFAWLASAGGPPTGYNLQVDSAAPLTTTQETSAITLAPGSHTWTVRAFNLGGYSDWAAPWTIEVRSSRVYLPFALRPGSTK